MIAGAAALVAAALAAAPPADSVTVASSRGVRVVAVRSERGWPAVAAPDLAGVLSVTVDAVGPGTARLHAAGRRFAFVLDDAYFRFGEQVLVLAAPPVPGVHTNALS